MSSYRSKRAKHGRRGKRLRTRRKVRHVYRSGAWQRYFGVLWCSCCKRYVTAVDAGYGRTLRIRHLFKRYIKDYEPGAMCAGSEAY